MKENRISAIRHAVTKGFNIDEGPCIKCTEKCLNDIGVCHQRYYGGIFVGNHVHTILKVYEAAYSNIYNESYISALQCGSFVFLC